MILNIYSPFSRNHFEVLNFSDRKPKKLWNEVKEVVKGECEKTAKNIDRKEGKLYIEEKRSQSQGQKSQKGI